MEEGKKAFLEYHFELIKHLRQEARDVKQCFTAYSYLALIFSSAALGSVFTAIHKYPIAAFSVVPIIIFLMIICRTGIFKYATANRIYGYELHLERINSLHELNSDHLTEKRLKLYKLIGWEETQRAWRIVQTAIFRRIYRTPDEDEVAIKLRKIHLDFINYFRPDLYGFTKEVKKLKDSFRSSAGSTGVVFQCNRKGCEDRKGQDCIGYPWFLIDDLSEHGIGRGASSNSAQGNGLRAAGHGTYHAGSYLKNILGVLILMQCLLLIPLVAVLYMVIEEKFNCDVVVPSGWLCAVTLSLMSILIILRKIRIDRRRRMLENELLSIHSCSIVWQAVVLAHYSSLKMANCTFRNYTQYLSFEAKRLQDCAFVIHDWISRKTKELDTLQEARPDQANKSS